MTEELECTGAPEVIVDYEFVSYSTIKFTYFSGKYDSPSQRISRTVYDFTEGGISHTISGTLIAITNPNSRLYPNTYANLVAFSGEVKVIDLLEEIAILSQSDPQELIDGGIYENLITTNFDIEIDDTPSSTENRTYTYIKNNRNNGIRLTINSLDSNGRRKDFKIEEVNPTNNQVVRWRRIEDSSIGIVRNYSLTCENRCPPNTCEVDCGNYICCYGSDGIAVISYLK